MTQKIYPSKIMLVGEYGVVAGGSALTIPFSRFTAKVRLRSKTPSGMEEDAERSARYLRELYQYIQSLGSTAFHASPDLEHFRDNLGTYWLEMDIPTGYGLGSSGAVSAAVYDLFFPGNRDLALVHQKEDLATIESFFHGKSSGVDPLTCHAASSLYFRDSGEIERTDFAPGRIPGGYLFFLLDSGIRVDTGPLVVHFLERMEDAAFASSIRNEYLGLNLKLIETLLGMRDGDPALLVRVISDYQFRHFRRMIPEEVSDLWIEGQVSNEYYLKLNGSGGGFLLGIAHAASKESLQNKWKEKIIWIE